jgi:hypothetical protein
VAEVIATYAVHAQAGATVAVNLVDVADPDMVAQFLAEDVDEADVARCHHCEPQVGGLTGFTINGVDHVRDDETGHWVPSGGGSRG